MSFSIISAIGKNNEIGKKNALLWNLPVDLKHFKEITTGKTIIIGQKTFESIGRPLPNRRNIVLTQDKNFKTEGVEVFFSIEELEKKLNKEEENFIIGGGQIYRLFLEKADKLYITHVDASFPDADTFFPEINPAKWQKKKSENYKKDEKNAFDLEFAEYIKKQIQCLG
jgi:dihydrofolate reductase